MNAKYITLIIALFSFSFAWGQTSAKRAYLRLVNNEGKTLTEKDSVVSKKFFESPVVTLESNTPFAKGTEITLMLGEKGVFFENNRLSSDIKEQIRKLPPRTEIVFSVEQETLKELKFLIVE
jgi:hypothetical protein